MSDGLTREQRVAQQLMEINAILASDLHYEMTPTRFYGDADPYRQALELLFPCVCGTSPILVCEERSRDFGRPRPYMLVRCPACGNEGTPRKEGWEAIVSWNRSAAATKPALAGFPFFGITFLSPDQARDRLLSIRNDLELRRKQASLESILGLEVGRAYYERLCAYLEWVQVAFAVVTAAETGTSTQQLSAHDARRLSRYAKEMRRRARKQAQGSAGDQSL